MQRYSLIAIFSVGLLVINGITATLDQPFTPATSEILKNITFSTITHI